MRRSGWWLGVLLCAAAGCGGGGGGGNCVPTTDISGLYTGPVTNDSVSRGNPGTVRARIEQTGCELGGTWSFDFDDSRLDQDLLISGSSPTTDEVALGLNACVGPLGSCNTVETCTYVVTGTLVSPTQIVGTYATDNDSCSSSRSGDFDISLLARLTPTPVPTAFVAPTAAPTPTPTP